MLKLPTYECRRCGHVWHPRKPHVPTCCARCKSPYWRQPKKNDDQQVSQAKTVATDSN